MRYKVAPPPRDLAFLERARDAIPLVPDSEADCCRAIQRATDVTDRDTASEYLVLLQALGLVAKSDRGYYRTRADLGRDDLGGAYAESVFGADLLLETLGDEPIDAEAGFEAIRDDIPRWERERHGDWETVWRERVAHLLGWAVVFGLAAEVEDGFVSTA